MKITVMGSGYVGTTTAVVLASLNHQVIGTDIDSSKVEKLSQGILPFVEPGLDKLLVDMLGARQLRFTDDIQESIQASEVLIIAVGTPSREDGTADLKYLKSVADTIAGSINEYKVVVIKSTVPLGTNRWLSGYLADKIGDNKLFDVISNPEFLKEGVALNDSLNPDRTVIGGKSQRAISIMKEVYQPLNSNLVITDWETAELIKYASNSFLATKISFINEIAQIADRGGADIIQVAHGMGLDPRIGSKNLHAGIGYGGSCFPKDIKALIATAKEVGLELKILKEVERVNGTMPDHYVEKLVSALSGSVKKPWTIAVLGLTFKPNTDDQRESPAIHLINKLMKECKEIRILDPTVLTNKQTPWPTEKKIKVCQNIQDTFMKADAVILCTTWEMFAQIDWKEAARYMANPILLDAGNMYDPEVIRAAGILYLAIGRGN